MAISHRNFLDIGEPLPGEMCPDKDLPVPESLDPFVASDDNTDRVVHVFPMNLAVCRPPFEVQR
jgi:hypothetical protein